MSVLFTIILRHGGCIKGEPGGFTRWPVIPSKAWPNILGIQQDSQEQVKVSKIWICLQQKVSSFTTNPAAAAAMRDKVLTPCFYSHADSARTRQWPVKRPLTAQTRLALSIHITACVMYFFLWEYMFYMGTLMLNALLHRILGSDFLTFIIALYIRTLSILHCVNLSF